MWKAEQFPWEIRSKARMSSLTHPIDHYIGSHSQCNKERKNTDWKVKFLLTFVYVKIPMRATQNWEIKWVQQDFWIQGQYTIVILMTENEQI